MRSGAVGPAGRAGRRRGARAAPVVGLLGALGVLAGAAVMVAAGLRARRPARVEEPFAWPSGLTEAEAAARRRPGQSNAAHLKPVRTWANVQRESVFTVFNLNLLGLAAVEVLLAQWLAAAVSVLMLGLTTGIRVAQERMAARRLARFTQAGSTLHSVIREGRLRSVDPDLVVPGDVLVAGPGDQVLVDGRLLGLGTVTVDTSAFTGRGGWQRVRPGGPLHAGTFCVSGRAVYRAERVGEDRLVSARLATRPALASRTTPLERLVAGILRVLLVVVACYLVLLLAAFLRLDLGESVEGIVEAAPVIFSLLPSGLYLMIIVSYATGTADLARDGALVHSARSVESLAETTVFCFTEAGTLAGTALELTPLAGPGGGEVPVSRLRQVLGDFARSTSVPSAVVRLVADSFDGERRAVREEAPHLGSLGWSAIAFAEVDAEGVYVLAEPAVLAGHTTTPLPDLATPAADDEQQTLVVAYRPDTVPLTNAAGAPRLPDGFTALGTVQFRRRVRPEAMEVVRGFLAAGARLRAFTAGRPEDALAVLRAAGLGAADEEWVRSRGTLSRRELERIPRRDWGAAAAGHALFGGLTPLQVGALVRARCGDAARW